MPTVFKSGRTLLCLLLPLSGVLLGGGVLSSRAQEAANSRAKEEHNIPDWKTLQAPYAYDAHEKPVVKTEEKADPKAYVLHLEFKGPSGDRVTGLYVRPKKEGVYPCVLLLHGWTSKKEDMAAWIGSEIVDSGMAYLALDAPRHGERATGGTKLDFTTMWHDITIEGTRDYRMAMLWLAARKDVDSRHIGLFGYSMGAMMGSVLTSLDNRVQAAALCVGGDLLINHIGELPADKRAAAYTLSPSLYIGHVAPRPILMLNGGKDQTVKADASQTLYSAAKEPKTQTIYADAGHILPKHALEAGVKWLALQLKAKSETKN